MLIAGLLSSIFTFSKAYFEVDAGANGMKISIEANYDPTASHVFGCRTLKK